MDAKEQKLAAARRKLRQYQKRKEQPQSSSYTNRVLNPQSEIPTGGSDEYASSRSSSSGELRSYDQTLVDDLTQDVNVPNNSKIYEDNDLTRFHRESSGPETPECSTNEGGNAESLFTKCEYRSRESEVNTLIDGAPLSELYLSERNNQDGSVSSDTNATETTVIHTGIGTSDASLRSTTETLRQLSFQTRSLLHNSDHATKGERSCCEMVSEELETRNNELATLLERERQTSLQQSHLVVELKQHVAYLEMQLSQSIDKNSEVSVVNPEYQGLLNQLQTHIQTIGAIEADKTGLQTSLEHALHSLENAAGEVTDLKGRLDASRHRVSQLEALNHNLEGQNSSMVESSENNRKLLSNLQATNTKTNKLSEDLKISVAELTERLSIKTEDNEKLTTSVSTYEKELALAKIHIEQLRDDAIEDLRNQFEQLEVCYNEALHKVNFLASSLQNSELEKNGLEEEYKSYVSRLTSEMTELREQVDKKDRYLVELEESKGDLQKQVKSLVQSQSPVHLSQEEPYEVLLKERDQLRGLLKAIGDEKNIIQQKYQSLYGDQTHLSQIITEQRLKLEEFEAATERSTSSQVDTKKLLESMRSDKVAAARALAQNKQLKDQLEELQNGFMMMSNKKLELTEKLENELHLKKKLSGEISDLNQRILSFKQSILVKERENLQLKQNSEDRRYLINDSQNPDPVLDSVSPDVVVDDAVELAEAADKITENKNDEFAQQEETTDFVEGPQRLLEGGVAIVNESEMKAALITTSEVSKEAAKEALENKFTQCMGQLAFVSDEKQRLEYVVQQLQVETDTVGDYITFYQFQRGVLKKQMEDLTTELGSLRKEKELMRTKLSTLQDLVSKLVLDKMPSDEKFLSGLHSFIDSDESGSKEIAKRPNSVKEDPNSAPLTNGVDPASASSGPPQLSSERGGDSSSGDATVQKIVKLIKEMESANDIDNSGPNKFQSCALCSGSLMTI